MSDYEVISSLKTLMLDRGISLKNLAYLTGIPKCKLTLIYNNDFTAADVTIDDVTLICRALPCKFDELLMILECD